MFQPPNRQEKFKIENSCFKNWVIETKEVIEQCLEADYESWKVMKIKRIDFVELGHIKRTLRLHFEELAKFFKFLQCTSNYPHIMMHHLICFCMRANIIDHILTRERVQQIVEASSPNKVRISTRSSFYEFLIRLAEAKFIEQDVETKYDASLNKLIIDHVLKDDTYFGHSADYRRLQIQTIEIDDLLKENMGLLQ